MTVVFGLSEEDLKNPTMTELEEVCVHDGKGGTAKVRVGDKVELLNPDDEYHLDYLGPGPYTIEWLARWRCGRKFLQLTTTKGKGKGMNADSLKVAS